MTFPLRYLVRFGPKQTSHFFTEVLIIGGGMQHIEEAGVHSGDSSCVLPAVDIAPPLMNTIREITVQLARALKVVGLMNVQFAIQRDTVYVIEVNPRASRTVPYVSKATGVPLAKIAARLAQKKPARTAKQGRAQPDRVEAV